MIRREWIYLAATFSLFLPTASPFEPGMPTGHQQANVAPTLTTTAVASREDVRRRNFLATSLIVASLPFVACHAPPVNAVMMEQPKESVFQAGQILGVEEAKARFQDAQKTLDYLIDNYDNISKEGGDNVRRYLGTVGTTSALYGIPKVMKDLQVESDDIVEFTENMQDFNYYLRAADTAVYSANFVEFSAAKTKPEKFFEDARSDCLKARMYMNNMAHEIGL
jgi:hypothetical protein